MISSRRLAREWALKILYQREHFTPAAQSILEATLRDIGQAGERLRQQLMREAVEVAVAGLGNGQEHLEREVTQAGYSFTETRELLQDLRNGGNAVRSKRPVPFVVRELAQAFALLDELRIQGQRLQHPLRADKVGAYLAEARERLEDHARVVRSRLQQEVVEGALERLRLEFVQRGSHAASGSLVEQICLDVFTSGLRDMLPELNHTQERALSLLTARLLGDAPYWQEQRIDRLFREPSSVLPHTARRMRISAIAQTFGLSEGEISGLPALQPPRLLTPAPSGPVAPETGQGVDSLNALLEQLSAEDRTRLQTFARQAREQLPERLEPEFRKEGIAFVQNIVANRPSGVSHADMQAYLRTQRETFNRVQTERWKKVGVIVEKQAGDWLRTASFALKLVLGASEKQAEIDAAIGGLSAGWNMERQVAVDRNILRIGAFEMLFMEGVPTAASINEAVELAKKYSTTESGRFVNGVLGALAVQVGSKSAAKANLETAENLPDDNDDMIDLAEDEDVDLDETALDSDNSSDEESA